MNLIGIARHLHKVRQDNILKKRGRPPSILLKHWEDLTEEEESKYIDEVKEAVAAIEASGHIVTSDADLVGRERRVNPLKVVRKQTGNLQITGG